jgi:aminoglycoside phosphotransferase (APT) family kinase protein
VPHQWQPELVVDEALARDLVHGQFPDVPAVSVELVGAGWDYTVHRVDGEWAFRFPRREVVLEPMRRELKVLPRLAGLLPVPVPEPMHVGVPTERYPWPFFGARWLPGEEVASGLDRTPLARPLARFLRRLHAPDILDLLHELPFDVVGRADARLRALRTREELAALDAEGIWRTPRAVEALLRRAERLPPAEPLAVCHGDLHFRQLLVEDGALSGVVDWVDVCRSDPGIDLQLVYALLPAGDRPTFFDEYGPVAEGSLLRARVLALNLSAVLARYGRANGLDPVEREAVASLDRAVADL